MELEENKITLASVAVIYEMLFVPVVVEIFRRFITYIKFRMKIYQKQSKLLQVINLYLDNEFLSLLAKYGLISIIFTLLCIYIEVFQDVSFWEFFTATGFVLAISFGIAFMDVWYGYDKAEMNYLQRDDESIGSYWAGGAFESYFKVVLANIRERMIQFEVENDVQFYVKKLILVCPLSCDVRHTFTDKDEKVEYVKDLRIIEHDQGANINRKYKNSVYKVLGNEMLYIAAECPNSLLTLWKIRHQAPYNSNPFLWKYHRNCFLKNLKELLQDEPCILLIYDDTGPSKQPLHKFLEYELNEIKKDQYIK